MPGLLRAGLGLRPRLAEDHARERDGDHYVVNGQKTWTTLAQYADWIFCLVRTDPAAKKQEGISFLLIDMKTPGHHRAADPDHRRRPRGQRGVLRRRAGAGRRICVGEENKGWDYAKYLLGNERTGIARVGISKERIRRLKELAALERVGDKPLIEDERFREKIAAVEVELKALEMTQLRVVAAERRTATGSRIRPRRSSRSRARRSSRRSPSC